VSSTLAPSTREIIIICDCGTESMKRLKKNFEEEAASGTAMIETLQEALTEGAAPILVTGQLMDFLVSCKQEAPKYIKSTNDNEKLFYTECLKLDLNKFYIGCMNSATSETPSQYTGVLYLIIPKSYLSKYGITDADFKINAKDKKDKDPRDAKLGLQVSKFKPVTIADIRSNPTPENKNCSSYLVQQLPNIFVTLPTESMKDNYDFSKHYPYVWSIVLNGHGSFSASETAKLQESLAKKRLFSVQSQEVSQQITTIDTKLKEIKAEQAQIHQKAALLQKKWLLYLLHNKKKKLLIFQPIKKH